MLWRVEQNDTKEKGNLNNIQTIFQQRTETSRERPKSAPYLRLKNSKAPQSVKYSLLQYPHEEKMKIEFFWIFFRNFFDLR